MRKPLRMLQLLSGFAVVSVLACESLIEPPAIGGPVPDLDVTTMDGESVSLADYRGEPMVINLWATWCIPCRVETPYLQSVFERYAAQGLRMVAISVDNPMMMSQASEFLDDRGVTYDRLHDPNSDSMNRFFALGLPATFVIDRDGLFRFVRYGPILEGDPEFESAIEGVLE